MTKVLCIGGSTYNPGTPQAITKALIETNFLEEWAVIFANHLYFPTSIDAIKSNTQKTKFDFQGLETTILLNEGIYNVEPKQFYIVPDVTYCPPDRYLVVIIKRNKNSLVFDISNDSSEEFDKGFYIAEENDILPPEQYSPHINKIMMEISESCIDKFAGLIIAGLRDDGAKGLLEIKKRGGYTAVQNPSECYHPQKNDTSSMPTAALNLDRKHKIVSIFNEVSDSHEVMSFNDWLMSIK